MILFVSTNIDDSLIVLGLLSDPRFLPRNVPAGQYLGLGLLVLASVLASLASLVTAPTDVGLLGLLPIVLWGRKLPGRSQTRGQPQDEEATEFPPHTQNGTVDQIKGIAAVTIANGSNNLSLYTPLFSTKTPAEIALITLVFAIMTAVRVTAAH
ncbi:cadmium resistance transporter [Deinococcus multiflagellatus]|uniref:Cadmium resistance transporter n=1 Tax=Deinococcus multiflagellatus TaxID=1656887 RepID=A0ABW1ZS89_9DEIO|nr:cadmium resistance transporter [Deinococcus multiflagellatus]MBZ9715459.1 cadmium resistance transporter [Deinococcus multiflagellatus]